MIVKPVVQIDIDHLAVGLIEDLMSVTRIKFQVDIRVFDTFLTLF